MGYVILEQQRKKSEAKNELCSLVYNLRNVILILGVQERNLLQWYKQLLENVEAKLDCLVIISNEEIIKSEKLSPIILEDYERDCVNQLIPMLPNLLMNLESFIDAIVSINAIGNENESKDMLFNGYMHHLATGMECIVQLNKIKKEVILTGEQEISKKLSEMKSKTYGNEYALVEYKQVQDFLEIERRAVKCISQIENMQSRNERWQAF